MQTTVKLQSLPFFNARTYIYALIFIAGNILLPQLCHMLPSGGHIWLPIYFFTLIGAYKYGWRVGLLTAIASPLLNSVLFGMPPVAMLPAIIVKSVLLATAAGFAAEYFKKASLVTLLCVILFYQTVGTACELALHTDIYDAFMDFRLGLPGMAVQLFGGWLFINKLIK